MKKYFTKSLFKTGLICPTGLYYSGKPENYVDEKLDDPFLEALAYGGFQVGELAKFLFCEDPVADQITILDRDYERSEQETLNRLKNENALIAEAAVRFENLFVRVDILQRENNVLKLYEVKSKKWNNSKDFWTTRDDEIVLSSKWLEQLYDVAFQKFVLTRAFPEFTIQAHLIFMDAEKPTSIEGMNQHFKIERGNSQNKIIVTPGLKASALGQIPLRILPVDRECDWIYNHVVEVDLEEEIHFEALVKKFSDAYQKDERIWSHPGNKCKSCSYQTSDSSLEKSGFVECWKHWAGFTDKDFAKPLTLELWGGLAGGQSIVTKAIRQKKFFLRDLSDEDYYPKKPEENEYGLSNSERRKKQIEIRTSGSTSCYLDKFGLRRRFEELAPPYHFIDFETTMTALPFHKDRAPYDPIAFQYSYHLMDEHGSIRQAGQFLAADSAFPNYDFIRALKNDLGTKEGTIFRYHHHENNYLNFIYRQLKKEDRKSVPDKNELMEFIKTITHSTKKAEGDKWEGEQDMVDLYELVLAHYYSPRAKGSNSLKEILPSAIHDSNWLMEKYSEPIYGTEKCASLNFRNHTWITAETGNNPYHTLPRVLEEYDNDVLDQFIAGMDEIKEGGAAMMAYAYLQYSNVPPQQKEKIRSALLRYCELDTMAMVMLWEFWGNEIGWFK